MNLLFLFKAKQKINFYFSPPHGQAKTTLALSESAAASSHLRVFTGTPCGARHMLSGIHAHPAGDNDLIPSQASV